MTKTEMVQWVIVVVSAIFLGRRNILYLLLGEEKP